MAFSFAELETLMNYGFTAEQIMELNSNPAESQPDPKPEPQPDPKPDPQPDPKPDPQPDPKPDPQPESAGESEALTALKKEIADLKSTIQKQNIINKGVDTLPDNDKTVENALASLIRPPYEEKKK